MKLYLKIIKLLFEKKTKTYMSRIQIKKKREKI